MAVIFVVSPEVASGKTAVCAGICKQLVTTGKKVGYIKPGFGGQRTTGEDTDAIFMKRIFALDESVDDITPIIENSKSNNAFNNSIARIVSGKDILIVELEAGVFGKAAEMANALGAKVIIVRTCAAFQSETNDIYQQFGKSLLGVIINKVPSVLMERVQSEASRRLNKLNIPLLGALPEDRKLMGIAVSEIPESVCGEALPGGEDKLTELIENVMLGAMILDYGPDYFGRKDNKAVIIRSERPDMQLAALQTSVECMILTGETRLPPVVIQEANAKNTPIILVKDAIPAVVAERMENAIAGSRFNQPKKLSRMVELMRNHLDMETILSATRA